MTTTKYALVTGATSGIGYELTKLFAQDGYNLVLVARGEIELLDIADWLRTNHAIKVLALPKDLFNREAAKEIYDEVQAKGIQIDVLVNDAGQGLYGEFITTDLDREIDIVQLNIISLISLTKFFLQEMVARGGGKILNVASIAGKLPGPLQSVYHGTKAFVHSFTEAIREEVKDKGVTITSLLPGATATDFFNKADMLESKLVDEGKLADAADVARDGYDALLKGEDMIVSGAKNKLQVAMANVTPDATVAKKLHKQQGPKDRKLKKLTDTNA